MCTPTHTHTLGCTCIHTYTHTHTHTHTHTKCDSIPKYSSESTEHYCGNEAVINGFVCVSSLLSACQSLVKSTLIFWLIVDFVTIRSFTSSHLAVKTLCRSCCTSPERLTQMAYQVMLFVRFVSSVRSVYGVG